MIDGKPKFDPAAFVAAVREVFADVPTDFQYESPVEGGSCVYTHHGVPSCLFGKALAKMGVRIPSYMEGNSIRGVVPALFDLNHDTVYSYNQGGDVYRVMVAAGEAQEAQDALAQYSYVRNVFDRALIREGFTK